jgi:hypothetical protein
MPKQNNEWLYSLYQGFILDYAQSDCDISLWICMYCLKLYLLYLIIIVLRATGKISLLLLTVLPSWNKVITYLLMQHAKLFAYVNNIQITYKMYSAGQTVPSTAQIRAEGNNTKCVGKKRFDGSVTHGLRKKHVLRSPSHFGQGTCNIIYANHLPWYIVLIVVFSKSRDKWLKNKLTWRNDRVFVKIVLYSSATPLSEGKMVMNE